ncbi:sugar phosphate isomerase/epimerase family protein [Sphingobium tyrosinilyticum]|uniref:Sugar phosphate isomerase/epimerase family protein n=1 Tax=Sphingobium tyrosinilyticum TaxID=2715436 RepID=A0ABV9F1X1_9SPHN
MTPSVSINTLCLESASLYDHAALVARLGAEGIGVTVDQVLETSVKTSRAILRDTGLTPATMTHRAFGFATPELTAAGRERLLRTIDVAGEVGALSITMTSGGRGELRWAEALQRFADAVAPCAQVARQAGVALALEPTSHLYADASIAYRLSDLVAIARLADINLGIDIFACWFDSDIEEALVAAAPLCRLVQVSDYVAGDRGLPCRAVPGDGMIPLHRMIPAILRAGYRGWFDLEIIGPRLAAEGVEEGLSRAVSRLRSWMPDSPLHRE